MHADHRLHGRQRVLAGLCRVIDKRLGDLDVLGEPGNEVDVALAVTVHGRTQLDVLFDRLLEIVLLVGLLGQDGVLLGAAVSVGLSFAVAAASYYAVERPFLRWKARLARV